MRQVTSAQRSGELRMSPASERLATTITRSGMRSLTSLCSLSISGINSTPKLNNISPLAICPSHERVLLTLKPAIRLGLRLAIGCARKPRLLPVGVQCQRSHDHVRRDYRQGIHPDAVADPQKGSRRLETTHGSRRLAEVRSGEERRRHPPETVMH